MKGVIAGDTYFYLRHCNSDVMSDIIITSKTSEEENPDFKSFRMFGVSELTDHYKYSD